MSDKIDILLKIYETEWSGARHHENQRSVMANYIITISAVAVGFFVQKGLNMKTISISIFLILLGIYGLISSQKFYERFMFHVRRAKEIRSKLDLEHCHSNIEALMRKIDKKQRSKHKISSRIHLYWIWWGPSLVSLIIGIGTLISIIYVRNKM